MAHKVKQGGSIPNDSLAWTGCKYKSNLFHWHRKERSPPSLPPAFFFFFSYAPPSSSSPTQQLFLSLSALPPPHPASLHAHPAPPPPPLAPVRWLCFIVAQRLAGKPPSGVGQGSDSLWALGCSIVDAQISKGLVEPVGHLVSKWALWWV